MIKPKKINKSTVRYMVLWIILFLIFVAIFPVRTMTENIQYHDTTCTGKNCVVDEPGLGFRFLAAALISHSRETSLAEGVYRSEIIGGLGSAIINSILFSLLASTFIVCLVWLIIYFVL